MCNLCLDLAESFWLQHSDAEEITRSGKATLRWIGDGAAREKGTVLRLTLLALSFISGVRQGGFV